MRGRNLAIGGLQDVGISSLQHAGARAGISSRCSHSSRMLSKRGAAPSGFNAEQFHAGIAEKRMEQANGVRAPAYTSDEQIRQTVLGLQNLRSRLYADYSMKISHHTGIGMCSQNRSEQIVRRANIRDPVAH